MIPLSDGGCGINMDVKAMIEQLTKERDEYKSEVSRLNAEVAQLRERFKKRVAEMGEILVKNIQELIMENPKHVVSEMSTLIKESREAKLEVERLRNLTVSLSDERWELVDEIERRLTRELEAFRDENLRRKRNE